MTDDLFLSFFSSVVRCLARGGWGGGAQVFSRGRDGKQRKSASSAENLIAYTGCVRARASLCVCL